MTGGVATLPPRGGGPLVAAPGAAQRIQSADGVSALLICGRWQDFPLADLVEQERGEGAAHLMSDPPYESAVHVTGLVDPKRDGSGPGMGRRMLTFAPMTDAERADVAQLGAAIAGWSVLFCTVDGVAGWRAALEGAGGRWHQAMVWNKTNSAPKFNGQGPAIGYEMMALAWHGRGHSRWNGGGQRGVYSCPGVVARDGGPRDHPTVKPAELMRALVGDFTNPGDLVVDPYMGSGTTGVAALRLGRAFLGVEADTAHFETACQRIAAVADQASFFGKRPMARPMQHKMRFDQGATDAGS